MSNLRVKIDRYKTKRWYLNGDLHREDGPAIEWTSGNKFWYLNGKCHREDGPAVEWADGSKSWYLNDKLHHEDGPALEYADGTCRWYLNGKELAEEEFNSRKTIVQSTKIEKQPKSKEDFKLPYPDASVVRWTCPKFGRNRFFLVAEIKVGPNFKSEPKYKILGHSAYGTANEGSKRRGTVLHSELELVSLPNEVTWRQLSRIL